jgi:nicotinamidase-related amidase
MIRPEEWMLAVIDVQPRLLDVMWRRDRLLDRLARLLRGAEALQVPVLVTEQVPAKLGGTEPGLRSLMGAADPIAKSTFSALGEPAFASRLAEMGRRCVWLAGIETHVCVYQTASDLLSAGYRVDVVADAVSSRTEEDRRLGLERMRTVGAGWTSVEMALFEGLDRAEGETFRAIHRIVK